MEVLIAGVTGLLVGAFLKGVNINFNHNHHYTDSKPSEEDEEKYNEAVGGIGYDE